MSQRMITRRQFLGAAAATVAGAAVAAYTPTSTFAQSSSFKEAPMLADLVKAGKLPAVEKRLPKEPLVLKGVEVAVGKYGGDLNTVGERISPLNGYNYGLFSGQQLIFPEWSAQGSTGKYVPNIAKSWEVSSDFTKFTFHLREGLNWSDGKPYTADDIEFYMTNVLKNDKLSPVKPTWLKNSDESLVDFKKVDNYTVTFTFKNSQPWFLEWVALAYSGYLFTFHPKHYMMQFHPDFVKEADMTALLKKENAEDWAMLYGKKVSTFLADSEPAKPRMTAFIAKKVAPDTPPWIYERNPYFWAVDGAGNQLPYLDSVRHTQLDVNVKNLKSITGESDYTWGMDISMYPEMKAAQDKGKIRIIRFIFPGDADHRLHFNLQCKDEAQRKIYEDIRFRKAISFALDRDEINNLLYLGLMKPSQASLPTGTVTRKACDELKLAEMYTKFDPKQANQLLDEVGLNKKNGDGWRLRPDGKELFIEFITYGWQNDIELEVAQLQKVGIHATFKMLDSKLFWERVNAMDWDAVGIAGTPMHPWFVTVNSTRSFVPAGDFLFPYPQYSLWNINKGTKGEEPKGKPKEVLEKWKQIFTELDEKKRLQLVVDIVKTATEELWTISTLTMAPMMGTVNPTLKNLPNEVIMGWDNLMADVLRPETLFYDKK